jgi:hypothetical protein
VTMNQPPKLRDYAYSRVRPDRPSGGYNGGSRLGPQLGGRVRLTTQRTARMPQVWKDRRGSVVGADVSRNLSLVEWDHMPGIVQRIPYSWLAEVAS